MKHIPNSESGPADARKGEPEGVEEADDRNAVLTPGQEAAIAALVGTPTYAAAAKAAGVGARTLRRWIHGDARFRQRLREARSGVFDQTVRAIHQSSPAAAEVLDGIAKDAAAPQTARVSAARALLHYSCRGHEMADVDGRLSELEERIEAISRYIALREEDAAAAKEN